MRLTGVFYTSEGAVDRFLPKNTDKKRGDCRLRANPLVMLLLEARQTNRSGVLVVSILTRGDYINTVQLSYFACRTFIFHITSPYTNKSITDCIIIIYDILLFVNTFLKFLFFYLKSRGHTFVLGEEITLLRELYAYLGVGSYA